MLRNLKRAAIVGGIAIAGYGVYQGMNVRDKYKESPKLQAPSGKTSGFEKWKEEHIDDLISKTKTIVKELKERIAENERLAELEEKIEDLTSALADKLKKTKATVQQRIKQSTKQRDSDPAVVAAENGIMVDKWRQLNRLIWRHGDDHASETLPPPRKIKLLIIGDSLAVGVGCDDTTDSPVLPQVIARVLNKRLHADVEWHAAGVVGGTVAELRTLLPSIKDDFLSQSDDFELICVIICGLNDWKHFLERFGMGPDGFRKELGALVEELGMMGCQRVFVPALPSALMATDPSFSLRVWPLRHVAAFICHVWDLQKYNLAVEMRERGRERGGEQTSAGCNDRQSPSLQSSQSSPCQTTHDNKPGTASLAYIDVPNIDRHYATPGEGNVAPDGVHPSSQGYVWWGKWLGEEILKEMDDDQV